MDGSAFHLLEDLDWPIVGFMMFFSLFVAIFYTAIFFVILKIKVRPKWLFFMLLPSIIGITALIYKPAVILVFLCIFGMTFLLGIGSMAYRGISEFIINFKTKSKNSKNKAPLAITILKSAAGLAIGIALLLTGPYAFILIVLYFIFRKLVYKDNSDRFLSLQTTLPTSKIRSISMGLVEVKGKTNILEPLLSKIGNTECIGYTYHVESISRDKDGDEHFSTISFITECNPFTIEDETGTVVVSPVDLELLDIPEDKSYRRSGKRYTTHVLLDNTEILVIGKASTKNQETIIEKETVKNVFALSPTEAVNRWNKFSPLRKSAIRYATVAAFFIAMILLASFEYEDNLVTVRFIVGTEFFTNLYPFK